jgi:hypothetical protein
MYGRPLIQSIIQETSKPVSWISKKKSNRNPARLPNTQKRNNSEKNLSGKPESHINGKPDSQQNRAISLFSSPK